MGRARRGRPLFFEWDPDAVLNWFFVNLPSKKILEVCLNH